MSEEAAEVGAKTIREIMAAGHRAGLIVQTEYPIPGGRIDVVWLWQGPDWFPIMLPMIGFEIESSWRTRKHIKGDFLNLSELQAGLGVIVLLGDDAKVESTRQFTRDLIDRHAARMEVWSEDDVKKLVAADPERSRELLLDLPAQLVDSAEVSMDPSRHTGKYRRLAQWLARQASHSIDATFDQIEEVLGFPLPPSSRRHAAHWSGYDGSAVARAISDAGWKARNVNLKAETLTFERHT